MKLLLALSFLGLTAFSAPIPQPVITTANANGTFGIVAGRLSSKPEAPVGISVQNGNLVSSTITDAEGRWGIVIRVLSSGLIVTSFDLNRPTERSAEVVHKIQ